MRATTWMASVLLALMAAAPPSQAALGLGATIAVTTPNDEYGSGSACSLREAIQTANTNADFGGCTHTGSFATGGFTDLITLPAVNPGYALARDGIDEDANASSDLDITSNITIRGAGAATTPIFLCAACQGRVLHVLAGGTTVEIEDVTLKLGKLPNGRAGAGLRVEPNASVELRRVTVTQNQADGNAGGILNRGTLALYDSVVSNNVTLAAANGGAGLFNSENATLTLTGSRVLGNQTRGNADASGSGAGIYNNFGTLTLLDTTVDGNTMDLNGNAALANPVTGDGGGIFTRGNTTIIDSTISNNVASGNDAEGGGIRCAADATTLIISGTVVFQNRAVANPDVYVDSPAGGGLFGDCGDVRISDSVISGNEAKVGGGIVAESLFLTRSTVANNSAERGGGIASNPVVIGFANNILQHQLVNSSILNNTATDDGGGLYLVEEGEDGNFVDLANMTIAGNTSNSDGLGGGDGGGFLALGFDGNHPLMLGNSVLAGNAANGGGTGEDCFVGNGEIASEGYNLVQVGSGCPVSGTGDKVNVVAKLATAANNGGPTAGASNGVVSGMLTRAPLADSPLVDAGDPAGCASFGNALATDQIGRTRVQDGNGDTVARCDIGAVEYTTTVFANGFE